MQLDIALRMAAASMLVLTAAVLMRSAPRSPVSRSFLLLALGIMGFLGVNTAFDAGELPEPLWSVASFFSRMAAVALWLFCLVLFDGRLRAPGVAWTVAGGWLILVVIDKQYLAPAPEWLDLSGVFLSLATAIVLHAGWRAMRGLSDDLIDSRRRARPLFALALIGLLAMDLAADLLQGYFWRPASFLLLQNALLVALTVALALWLLRADPGLTTEPSAQCPEPGRFVEPAPDPDATVLERIAAVMSVERPYLDADLTFSDFAAKVGIPEPILRRTINHRLGHGHFRNYLNGYRVEEAKRKLRDPASAGQKILAVALDSGFSSLASFNRTFRQTAGSSPSEYRASATTDAAMRRSR